MDARILCLGNELACDDGVGIRVGRILQALSLPPHIAVERKGRLGLELIDTLRASQVLVVVDAMVTGRPAGSCVVLDLGDPALAVEQGSCCHGLRLPEVLEIARRLAPDRLPARVAVVGVEAEVLNRAGTFLSDSVRNALPDAVEAALRLAQAPVELLALGRAEAERCLDWDPTPEQVIADRTG